MLVLKMLQKAKRRADGLMNQGLGLPPPAPADQIAGQKRALFGELISDFFGAIWSALRRFGR